MAKLKATILTKHMTWTLPTGRQVQLDELSQKELISFGRRYPNLVKVEEIKTRAKEPDPESAGNSMGEKSSSD